MSATTRFEGRVAWLFPDHFDVDEIVCSDNMHITEPGDPDGRLQEWVSLARAGGWINLDES